jgi:hypothetical protein
VDKITADDKITASSKNNYNAQLLIFGVRIFGVRKNSSRHGMLLFGDRGKAKTDGMKSKRRRRCWLIEVYVGGHTALKFVFLHILLLMLPPTVPPTGVSVSAPNTRC